MFTNTNQYGFEPISNRFTNNRLQTGKTKPLNSGSYLIYIKRQDFIMPRDVSVLNAYLGKFDDLTPYEFEDMVAEMYRCKGWQDVSTTTRSDDKGRDVIGVDKKGRRVYVEVKKHKNNVGRPVIQKLHSIMTTDHIAKGIVVTTSDFTQGAIEYAQKTSISLVNRKKFLTTCQYLLGEGPRVTALCNPIDIVELKERSKNSIDKLIYCYPTPSTEFIQTSSIPPVKLEKNVWLNFSIYQKFQNSTGSWSWTMKHSNRNIAINPTSKVEYNPPFIDKEFKDIEVVKHELEKHDLPYQRYDIAPYTPEMVKKIIQMAMTETKRYRGLNNQRYSKKCSPRLKNITIHFIKDYWQTHTQFDFQTEKPYVIKAKFTDNDFTSVEVSNFICSKPESTRVIMCQTCHDLIDKHAIKKKKRICRNCGKVVCDECSHSKKWFVLGKKSWCNECAELLVNKEIQKKTNKIPYKDSKASFKAWKRAPRTPVKFN